MRSEEIITFSEHKGWIYPKENAKPSIKEMDLLMDFWEINRGAPKEKHGKMLAEISERFFWGGMNGLEKQAVDTFYEFRNVPAFGIKNVCEKALGRIMADIDNMDFGGLMEIIKNKKSGHSSFEISIALGRIGDICIEKGFSAGQQAEVENRIMALLNSSMDEEVLLSCAVALSRAKPAGAYPLVKEMLKSDRDWITDKVRRMLRVAEEEIRYDMRLSMVLEASKVARVLPLKRTPMESPENTRVLRVARPGRG